MRKRSRLRNHKYIWRMLASFFMAIVLSLHAPLEAEAAASWNTGLSFHKSSSQYAVYLSAVNVASSGTTVASYSGDVTVSFYISHVSPQRYAIGSFLVPITFSVGKGPSFSFNNLDVSLSSYSAPDGFSFYLSGATHSSGGQSLSATLNILFDFHDFALDQPFSVTFHVEAGILAQGQLDAISSLSGSASVGTESKGYTSFANWYEYASYQSAVYNSLEALKTSVSAVKGSVDVVNSSVLGVKSSVDVVNNNLVNLSNWLNTMLNSIYAKIGAESSAIQSTLNANSKAEIADADRNATNIINKLDANSKAEIADADKNADDIMNSYDKSGQDSDNKRFEDSRQELQEQEDSLFSSAMEGFGSLDMSDYSFGRFSAMLDAFSFVSGFMQSCYVKMGDFGSIVSIGLVVMIATKVIGLYRFSTGGDSS